MSRTYRCAAGISLLAVSGVLLSLPPAVLAAPATPGAGNILQQTQPPKLPAPSGTSTGLRLEKQKAGASASKVRFAVKHIRITGNTLFSTATLHALVADGEGKQLTLGLLEKLAGRITDYYHAHGYSLARAVIPTQTVKDEVVRFEVIEARFGKINLNNHSRVHRRLLDATLSPLHSGQIVGDRTLDHSLLLLSDIPGVSSSASLKPGTMLGTSDLDVDVAASPLMTGSVTADNYGNRYTGRARVGVGVAINDPLHLGDALNLNLMTAGRGLDYGRASYDVVVNGEGTSLGASYAALHYILGGALSSLGGYGTANVASGWVRQPLVRSLSANVYAQAQLDNKRLRDHIDSTGIRTDRHLNDGSFSLSGDARDHLLGTDAVTTWSATWTTGHVSFDDPVAAVADAATARTAGHFSLWSASLTRLQAINVRDALYLSASGQWAGKNLDPVAKLVVGGPYGLRGYDMGVLSADRGYLGTVELRHRFNERVQAMAFYDAEAVKVNAKPWSTDQNTYTLSDVGLGVDVDAPYQWRLGGYLAGPVRKVPTSLGTSNTIRGWVQISKMF